MAEFTNSANISITGSSSTNGVTTFYPYITTSPVTISQQPHVVALPVGADPREEPPLAWLRRRVDEVCADAWAA